MLFTVEAAAKHSLTPYPYPEGKTIRRTDEHLRYQLEYNTRNARANCRRPCATNIARRSSVAVSPIRARPSSDPLRSW